MSHTIHKYAFPPEGRFSISMPDGAKVLSAGVQDNTMVLWAMVDTDAPMVGRQFALCATGQPDLNEVAEWGDYVGTIHVPAYFGTAYFHLFAMPFSIPTSGDLNDD